jgi:hypothetical protein
MEIDVAGALRALGLVADQLAALLEWEKLAQQERGSRLLPPFNFQDHNRNDIILDERVHCFGIMDKFIKL